MARVLLRDLIIHHQQKVRQLLEYLGGQGELGGKVHVPDIEGVRGRPEHMSAFSLLLSRCS